MYNDLTQSKAVSKGLDETFKEIDQNGDGKISFNEFVDHLIIHS